MSKLAEVKELTEKGKQKLIAEESNNKKNNFFISLPSYSEILNGCSNKTFYG